MAESPDKLQVSNEEQRDETITALAELVMKRDALKFGKFQVRANKTSPYQIDVGAMCYGKDTFAVGRAFAITLGQNFGSDVDVCFGVPGKGAVMAALAAFYYGHLYNFEAQWAFPQTLVPKPVEDVVVHGASLSDRRIVIIDDVLGDGAHLRDMVQLARDTGADVLGICVLIDRRERTKSNRLATTDIERDTGIPVLACCTVADLVKKMPESYLPAEKRELVIKHATVEGGLIVPPLLPPFNKLTGL